MCTDHTMAEPTAITIVKYDCTDYLSWSFEIEISLEQHQVLGIIARTEEAPNVKDGAQFKVR